MSDPGRRNRPGPVRSQENAPFRDRAGYVLDKAVAKAAGEKQFARAGKRPAKDAAGERTREPPARDARLRVARSRLRGRCSVGEIPRDSALGIQSWGPGAVGQCRHCCLVLNFSTSASSANFFIQTRYKRKLLPIKHFEFRFYSIRFGGR
jgi:hypothetical protein